MERSNLVFADSNYFIAFYNQEDSLHKQAVSLAKRLKRQGTSFVVTNFIFLEVVTMLAQRLGKENAIRVGKNIVENPRIIFIHIDEALQENSWQIFQAVKDKNISFVDCSIIAVMRAESIPMLLSFDIRDFKKLQKQYRFSLFPVET